MINTAQTWTAKRSIDCITLVIRNIQSAEHLNKNVKLNLAQNAFKHCIF